MSDKADYLQDVFDVTAELSREFVERTLKVAIERGLDPSALLNAVSQTLSATAMSGWDYDHKAEQTQPTE